MIVVAGEALVDLIAGTGWETAARPGGGPFNVARGLARLEQKCAFVGAIARDAYGTLLRAELAADGVDVAHVVATGAPTTLALATRDGGDGERYTFYVEGTSVAALTPGDVAHVPVAGARALHVGGIALALEPCGTAVETLVAAAGAATIVMVDPNIRPALAAGAPALRGRLGRICARADVVKVSVEDLAWLAPGTPAPRAAQALLGGRPDACALVTDGPHDVLAVTAAGDTLRTPIAAVEVVDTVGAGDAFCAGFLAAWLDAGLGRDALAQPERLAPAVAHAALVAGQTCRAVGATPPTAAQLRALS